MIGQRPSGGKMEFLLLTPMPLLEQHGEGDGWHCAEADGLIKPAKNARIGDHLVFGDDLRVEVLAKGEFGRIGYGCTGRAISARFSNPGGICRCRRISSARIRRMTGERTRPFMPGTTRPVPWPRLRRACISPGITRANGLCGRRMAEVTLHVGYGTFSPVRCEDIREHVMHEEFVEVPQATVDAIGKAKAEGRPVIAVGTTSARTLEAWLARMEVS